MPLLLHPALEPSIHPPPPTDVRVLAHGYSLNHTALSVHRMLGASGGEPRSEGAQRELGIAEFTELVRAAGLPLNQEGGTVKVGWRQCGRGQS